MHGAIEYNGMVVTQIFEFYMTNCPRDHTPRYFSNYYPEMLTTKYHIYLHGIFSMKLAC